MASRRIVTRIIHGLQRAKPQLPCHRAASYLGRSTAVLSSMLQRGVVEGTHVISSWMHCGVNQRPRSTLRTAGLDQRLSAESNIICGHHSVFTYRSEDCLFQNGTMALPDLSNWIGCRPATSWRPGGATSFRCAETRYPRTRVW